MERLSGKLLVAAPALLDPNFARSVVAIADHDEEGAIGLVLNRPTDALVADAVPGLGGLADCDSHLFIGGPVKPDAAILVAEIGPEGEALPVVDGIGIVRGDLDPVDLERLAGRGRVYAGHAGWGPGQLEGEIEREDWIIAPARGQDLLSEDPDGLWSAILTRLGGSFRLVATMPLDPSLN